MTVNQLNRYEGRRVAAAAEVLSTTPPPPPPPPPPPRVSGFPGLAVADLAAVRAASDWAGNGQAAVPDAEANR